MTTDRPASPTRNTALADRPSSAGRTQAPPSDAFSALLGAVAPKSDQPARRPDTPARRDHNTHGADRRLDRPERPLRDDAQPSANDVQDAPAAVAPEATTTEAATTADTPATVTTPSIFALQLTSPLPPAAPATATAPPAPAATAADAPMLPAFGGLVPASVAAATTATAPVTGEVAAATATPTEPAAAAGAIALPGLPAAAQQTAAADAEITLPENLLKPQAPAAATPAQAAPAHDGAVPASGSQPQTSADAQTSGQPNTPAPAPVPAATAHAATTDKPTEAAPAPPPAAATTPTALPVAPATPGMQSVERAVPLSRAVPTTGVLIHLASERGITHARLNLKPVELGGIEVRLQTTPAGIHAQLVADSPEAARMLSQAGDQLRQQLEDRNVNLLSLDVSTSSDQRNDQPGFSTDGFGENYRPGGSGSAGGPREDTVLMDAPAAAETTLVLPDGVHVDVLA